MGKREKVTVAEQDGIQYRRAKTWQIATAMLYGAAQMFFYMLMTYATYIGNSNYGILVGVTGVIITASRVFDGITDPICAYVIERFHCRFGKIRIFMMAGWAVMALATTAMCNWGGGRLDGAAGLIFFIVCYMLYIIGYTLVGISASMMGPVMTNDPRQRPTLSVWSTIYSYLAPTVIMIVFMVGVLPRYNNEISPPSLAAMNICVVFLSLVFFLLACIGITPYDKQENFAGVSLDKKDQQQPSFKDMWALIRDNKELQRYMVAACSDKLAQTIGSASVISTMLYGIMIGNLSLSTTISTVAMLPSIIFAIVGAKIAGRQGNKKVMVDWTWICMILNIIFALFLLFTDTTRITVALLPTALFILIQFANNAAKMIVSTATNALRMDIVDYELYRSEKYMPASVSATYSFVDKFISSFGATIATLMIGLIGYTSTTPQQGDPLTLGVRVMTVLLLCGFPVIGWVCTIVSMKKSELTREKMIEVQKTIADKKAAASEAE